MQMGYSCRKALWVLLVDKVVEVPEGSLVGLEL